LERCIHEIVHRHQILRSTFQLKDGHPTQIVQAAPVMAMPVTPLADLPPSQREAEVRFRAAQRCLETLGLSRGPLVRAELFKLAGDDTKLAVELRFKSIEDFRPE
jgi:hypothetical protein